MEPHKMVLIETEEVRMKSQTRRMLPQSYRSRRKFRTQVLRMRRTPEA